MRVVVRDNNVTQAYRKLKKLLHNEGVIKDIMEQSYYEKPSDKKRRKRKESINRSRKDAAKRLAKQNG